MSTTFRRDAPEQSLLLRAADDADLDPRWTPKSGH